ncbi:glutamate 5-kinase [Dehalococcoidia bacterium]|nr:glutamate 5-kinase [Dehalococcoidia bacterium]
MKRTGKRKYRRVIVKAGTSLLTAGTDELDLNIIRDIVSQIASLRQEGKQMILVSSGAVAAGRGAMKGLDGAKGQSAPDLNERQVLAAIGQGRLMHVYEQEFSAFGITTAQALVTRRDVNDRLGYLNLRNTLSTLLDNGVVPVVNENDVVAVDELEGEVFGDNDNLSALIANLIEADLLLILGVVEGMFTKDPNLHDDAEMVSVVSKVDDSVDSFAGPSSDEIGRGGMATKIEAARFATASGVDVVIASGLEENVLLRLTSGESLGTFFKASVSRLESRKRWMLSGLAGGAEKRKIKIDAGAKKAITNGNSSLLPAGVVGSSGCFKRGDIVSISDEDGVVVAAGITNYASEDLLQIGSVRSDRIEEILGYHYGDEVVHRDNLVLLVD